MVRSVLPPRSRNVKVPEFSRCFFTFGCSPTFLKLSRLAARSSDDSWMNASASGGISFGPTFLIIGTGTQRSRHSSRPAASLRSIGLISVIDFMCAFMKAGNWGSVIASITASTGASKVCLSSKCIRRLRIKVRAAYAATPTGARSADLVALDLEHRRAEADAHRALVDGALDLRLDARLEQVGPAALELVLVAVVGGEGPEAAFQVGAPDGALVLCHLAHLYHFTRGTRQTRCAGSRKTPASRETGAAGARARRRESLRAAPRAAAPARATARCLAAIPRSRPSRAARAGRPSRTP